MAAIAAVSLVSIVLALLIVWREVVHDREMRDLLNRIMARDYNDYLRGSQGRPPPRTGNVLKQAVMERHPAYNISKKEGDEG